MSTHKENLEIEKIRAEIKEITVGMEKTRQAIDESIARTRKMMTETSKITNENRWYPVLMASTIIGATAAILKLLGW